MRLESPTVEGQRALAPEDVAGIAVPARPPWQVFLSFGINGTSGNSETFGGNIRANALRETDDDRFEFAARGDLQDQEVTRDVVVQGKTQTVTRTDTTVQRASAGATYDYFLVGTQWFVGALAQFDHDRLQDLDLRSRGGGHVGYRFINEEDMSLLARVGAAYVHEDYRENSPTDDRSFVSGYVDERFRWVVTDRDQLVQALDILPNVEDIEDTLFHFELTYRHKVVKGLFFDVSLAYDYDLVPAEGRKKYDLTYGAGVGWAF